ncbi:MAG: SprT-like domain-containing protein [Candidatus Doudnabacteria bacterium]
MRCFLTIILLGQISLIPTPEQKLLDPDFEIATPAGKQVFREELALALAEAPGASAQTRQKFKTEAEKLSAQLFLKGQKAYRLPRVKLTVYWDSLKPIEVAMSRGEPGRFEIHLNEVMFFTYHDDHLKLVIPHEVAHLLHYQQWGFGNNAHDETFVWIVKLLAPNYEYKDFDLTPGCRLSKRLLLANGARGIDDGCTP